jgi:hypothetical protein
MPVGESGVSAPPTDLDHRRVVPPASWTMHPEAWVLAARTMHPLAARGMERPPHQTMIPWAMVATAPRLRETHQDAPNTLSLRLRTMHPGEPLQPVPLSTPRAASVQGDPGDNMHRHRETHRDTQRHTETDRDRHRHSKLNLEFKFFASKHKLKLISLPAQEAHHHNLLSSKGPSKNRFFQQHMFDTAL